MPLIVASLMLSLTGCGTVATDAAESGRASTEAASASPAPAEAEWVTFTTQDGLASWEMPADWTATLENGPDEMGLLSYTIGAPSGQVRLSYAHRNWGLGGPGCLPDFKPAFPYQVVATTALSVPVTPSDWEGAVPPRVAYETIQFPDHVAAGLGDTDALQGVDETACEFLHFVNTNSAARIVLFGAQYLQPDGTWADRSFATMDEADAYVDTAEYKTLTRILASLRVKELPAGLEGSYVLLEGADCGNFDLSGQTLSVAAGAATITTPGQVLTGTAVESAGVWAVEASAADGKTKVRLSGTVTNGVYSGSGDYGGINPSGETGWTCDVPQFTATPQ